MYQRVGVRDVSFLKNSLKSAVIPSTCGHLCATVFPTSNKAPDRTLAGFASYKII
jgi:hypothetical protein